LAAKFSDWGHLHEALGALPDEAISLGGGSISNAMRIRVGGNFYFMKYIRRSLPDFFLKEKIGLDLLRHSCSLRIPEVFALGRDEEADWIVMEYIESSQALPESWSHLGYAMAGLHGCSKTHFGLNCDNYIGELVQRNELATDWETFFVRSRLMPLVSSAKEHFSSLDQMKWERLYQTIGNFGFTRKPALLHGDLWQGNVMFSSVGAVLIDPAVYFGVPEMDIGMSRLFGGFNKVFYDSWYEEAKPEPGWQERAELCNLYPLLVHLNLFGAGYLSSVRQLLNRYV
jgi:fructosamine-3-kinase